MNIRPIRDQVVVRPFPVADKVGSIFIHHEDKDDKRPVAGEVISVGPGRVVGDKTVPVHVEPGDKVLWTHYDGSDVEWEGEKYLVLDEKEIMCKY